MKLPHPYFLSKNIPGVRGQSPRPAPLRVHHHD
jgi:hypothetical protein